jgi:hypothetical protein
MKPVIAMAIASAFVIVGLSVGAAPVSAAQKTHDTDLSSANKRSNHVRYYNGRHYNGHRYGYAPAYRRSYAADPSFSPSGRPYRPNIYSPCTIDLGYGRFTSCDR